MIDLKKIDKLNKLRNKAETLQLKTQEAFHMARLLQPICQSKR